MSLPSRQIFPYSERITPNDTLSFVLSTHPFTDPAICQVRPFRQRAHSAQKQELFFCHSALCGDRLRNLERNMSDGVPCAPYTHTHFILVLGPLGWQSMILRGMVIKA